MTFSPLAVEILRLRECQIVISSYCPSPLWPYPACKEEGGGNVVKLDNCIISKKLPNFSTYDSLAFWSVWKAQNILKSLLTLIRAAI